MLRICFENPVHQLQEKTLRQANFDQPLMAEQRCGAAALSHRGVGAGGRDAVSSLHPLQRELGGAAPPA